MSEVWARPVARIHCGNNVVGAGMLAPGGVVLTCAHVIVDALGRKGTAAGPETKVTLNFPFARLREIEATVAKDGWYPELPQMERGAGSQPSDIAVLELPESAPLAGLQALLIAETDPAPDTAFSAQGFPVGWTTGALAEGTLRGADASGRLIR